MEMYRDYDNLRKRVFSYIEGSFTSNNAVDEFLIERATDILNNAEVEFSRSKGEFALSDYFYSLFNLDIAPPKDDLFIIKLCINYSPATVSEKTKNIINSVRNEFIKYIPYSEKDKTDKFLKYLENIKGSRYL